MPALAMFLDSLVRSATVGGLVLVALKTTIVAAVALALLALRPRAAAASRHVAAVAALGAILVLPLASAWLPAWSLRVLPPARRVALARDVKADPSALISEGPLVGVVRFPNGAGYRERSAPANAIPLRVGPVRSAPAGRSLPRWPLHGAQTALLVSLAVSAALLARLALGHVLAWRLARGAEEIARGPLRMRLEIVRARLGVSVPVSLRHTPRIAIPVVTGFRRPVLLVPVEAREWSADRAEAVFTHELAHVRRGDALAMALAQVATALHWYQPLAWTLARDARRESERACDDVVLGCGIRATDYADHLFSIAAAAAGPEPAAGAALAFARRSHLEGRLLAILAPGARRAPARARAIAALATVFALLAGGLASVRVTRAASDGSDDAHAIPAKASTRWTPATPATQATAATAAVRREEARRAQETKCKSETCTETRTETVTAPSPEAPETPATAAWTPESPAEVDAVPATQAKAASSDHEHMKEASGERQGQQWFEAGRREYEAEKYMGAAQAYRHAAAAGYRAETALYNAACSYSLAGMKREAIETLAAALDAGFDDPDMVSSDSDLDAIRDEPAFAELLDRAQNTDSAREERASLVERFEAMRKEGSRDDDEWRSIGVELLRAREFDRALSAFEVAYRTRASSSDLYNEACVLALSGDAPRAMDKLRQSIEQGYSGDPAEDSDLSAIRRRPGFEELRTLAKDLQLYDGNGGNDGGIKNDEAASWRAALPRCERVTREHPTLGRAWFNLGFAQLRVGDAAASETSNKRALELGYRPATTMYNLACVASRRGNADAAMDWLARAETAGMRVWETAPGDRDLDRLHADPRFRALLERWDRQVGAQKREKSEKDKETKREKRKT